MAILSKLSSVVQDYSSQILQAIHDRTGAYLSDKQTNAVLSVAGAGLGALLLWRLLFAVPANMPPGPRPLPIIGNMLNMGKDKFFYANFIELRKKYGDIYTVYFGSMPVVALNTHELVKEAYMQHGAATSNRGYFPMVDLFTNGRTGIVFADDGPRLRMQRKLAHQALRRFTTGGSIDKFLDLAFEAMSKKLDEDPNLIGEDMGYLVAYNMLLSMCFGKTFSFEDPFFKDWVQKMRRLEELFEELGLLAFFPLIEYIPSKMAREGKVLMDVINKYTWETIDEHRRDFDPAKLTDFTYHLLSVQKEVEKDPEEKGNLLLLSDMNYMMILQDLFFAGTDTTRFTLNWVWHYLAAFPEVQRRAQEEVDIVVGRDTPVSSEHRSRLPYCDAVLHEILRIKTVVPMGLMHIVDEEITLNGYRIPKGTNLFSNNWSIHKDERYWKDPEAFLPERWLQEDGSYVYQEKGFVPFAMGRRSCIGESFVKVELLVLMAKMLQRFTLGPQPGYTVSVQADVSTNIQPIKQKPILATRRS